MQSVADSPEVLSLRNKLLTLKDSKNYAKNYYDMKNTLIDPAVVAEAMRQYDVTDLNTAAIRQIGGIVKYIEDKTGEEFVHFEMGVPGLPPVRIGIEAEHRALDEGKPAIYPPMPGIPELKREASRFLKAFVNVDISPEGCIPTVGSMQGAYAILTLCSQIDRRKDTILYIDPGFSVQKTQADVIGVKRESFDVYDYRAEKLGPKLESYLQKGNVAAILFSNPNNPTWMCLSDSELKTIGELATKYDTIVIEDLAYLGMDFRRDLGKPFQPPYQVSVSRYTDNYIIMMSASKIFSYAGQRIAVIAISDKIYSRYYEDLMKRYGLGRFGQVMVQRILYCLSSGTSHTAQYAIAAMLKAASDGTLDFVEEVKEYGRRTAKLKEIFQRNGFHIVYDHDLDEPLSDGFFFTVGYKDVEGGELLRQLMHYGVSAIVLSTTGSDQQGLRICASTVQPRHYDMLDRRLRLFNENYGK